MSPREWIWPQLDGVPGVRAAQRSDAIRADREAIDATVLDSTHIDVLIEEARRLTDAESARRSGADTRASTYLAVVGVFAPLLLSLAPTAAVPNSGWIQTALSLMLFIAAGVYLLGCGVWCFKVLRVSRFARVDAMDLARLWSEEGSKVQLAKQLLVCVCFNRAGVNEKVTGIKMAHEFGLRALITFVLAVIVRAAWEPVAGAAHFLGLFA